MDFTHEPHRSGHPSRHLHAVDSAPSASAFPALELSDFERDALAPLVGDEFARGQLDLFRTLIELVGDADALWRLHADPLPDEPFDWSGVDPSDVPFVRDVLALSDNCCDAILDTEYRTIARRILARVAVRDPRVLRRVTHPARCAAALVWLAGRANGQFGRRGPWTASMLWSWFGVANCSDRGRTLRSAAGLDPEEHSLDPYRRGPLTVGDAGLLHSRYRRNLVAQRDYMLEIAGRRRTWKEEPGDGRTARVHVHADPAKPISAVKGLMCDDGRATVIVGFGDRVEDAHYVAMSVPDAHELVRLVQHALDAALPSPGAS